MTIIKAQTESPASFKAALQDTSNHSTNHEGLLFIHGFNVTWKDAVLRTAQLAYDLRIDGPSIDFDWDSNGKIANYTQDRVNAEESAYRLAGFLRTVSKTTGIKKLHVVAHSMDNYVLALAMVFLQADSKATSNISDVAMAAPDVPADTFTNIYAPYFRHLAHVTIYESSVDRAMQVSMHINGRLPLGDAAPVTLVPGFDVIDATTVDTDFLGHGYFADSLAMLTDLGYLFRNVVLPRPPLIEHLMHGRRYFAFPLHI